jgi:hypothetical protein
MNGGKRRKILALSALFVVLVVLSHQVLFGKLFAYSPIRLGFTEHELSNVIVYLQDNSTYKRCEEIDALIPRVEEVHGLKFTHKPEVLIFRDSNAYLQRSTTKARYCAYPNGSLVVSPWAVQEASDGKISMEIYLSHELSHTLLYQHMGIANAYLFFPHWYLEGVAVYNSNQMGTSWYLSKAETYAYIRRGNFVPPEWFGSKKEDELQLTVQYRSTFAHCEFACMIDYLVESYGKDKFKRYQTELLESYRSDKVFKDVYGIDFGRFVEDFRTHAAL